MKHEDLAKIFEAVKVMPIRPTDVIVVRCAARISADTAARVKEAVVEATGHRNVLVLDSAADVEVLRKEVGWLRRLFVRG